MPTKIDMTIGAQRVSPPPLEALWRFAVPRERTVYLDSQTRRWEFGCPYYRRRCFCG
jgi:hypothetical protein